MDVSWTTVNKLFYDNSREYEWEGWAPGSTRALDWDDFLDVLKELG